jgi:hypothetical protein
MEMEKAFAEVMAVEAQSWQEHLFSNILRRNEKLMKELERAGN